MEEIKILDIGCGNKKTEGAIGIDIADIPGVDVVHDLNQVPYPFEDESFDEVHMLDVIEHLNEVIPVMNECHRLLKPGGKLFIRVVYWNHKYAWSDPTHVRAFSEVSFEFFVGDRRDYYTKKQFRELEIDYIYSGRALKWIKSKKLAHKLGHYICNVIQGMNVTLTK